MRARQSIRARGGRWLALIALLSVVAAVPAGAVDGVLEISHAAALAGGITPGDTPGYPVILDQPGSYRLTSDLEIPATSGLRGIVIEAGPVTVDLNGFAVRGPGTCSNLPPLCSGSQATVGIEVTSPEIVRIRNGAINGTFTGIYVPTTSSIRSLDLDDLAITGNAGTGIILSGAGESTLRDCRIDRNGIDGIDISIGQPVNISNTTFRSNGNIAVNSEGSASLVQDSHFVGNGQGIRSFFLGSPSAALVYRDNMFSANGTDVVGGTPVGDNLCSGSSCP